MKPSTETYRVPLVNLEMNVVYGCNLKCEYCTHLGRFMKGFVPLDELLFWYRSWNVKIRPNNVRIMGGEPLLHPQIEEVIRETRNSWENSRVELITNGLVLPGMKESFFECLKENPIDVTVSKHFDDLDFNKMFDRGIQSLKNRNIPYRIHPSIEYWFKSYRMDEQGSIRPYQSDPQKAWNVCRVNNTCTTLLDNGLYRCPQLGCYSHAVKQGFVSDDWKVVLDYQPLTPSCTREELEALMHGGACEQCSICPEEFQHANMYEKLNPFGLPIIHQRICGGNRG